MISWHNLIASLLPPKKNRLPDAEAKVPEPDGVRSLRYGLSLTISLALFPIAAVSAFQGFERARFDFNLEYERLGEFAQAAAADEENILLAGMRVLRGLSQADDIRNVSPDCDRALANSLIGLPAYSNLSRLNAEGIVVCSALPQAKGFNAGKEPLFVAARKSPDIVISGLTVSKVTHQPVIGGLLAMRDRAGHFRGALGFALNVHWLENLLRERRPPTDAAIAVFDRNGALLATNNTAVGTALARGWRKAGADNNDSKSVSDADGSKWAYATAPIGGSKMFVALARPEASLFSPTYISALADFALPFVMIALSWLAVWYAAERQITHWIIYLRRIVAAYRGGHYSVRPALEDAPSEFLQLGSAMAEMADGILDRDQRLRDAVTQKTLLVKEIHHRVKNNLQIVMSLLRLQAEQSEDSPLRQALSHAQARINALALVHRLLHEVDDQTTINLERLVTELANQMIQDMALIDVKLEIETQLAQRSIPGELAVPIALFAVEALANAFRHAFPSRSDTAKVQVCLRSMPDSTIRLTIKDNGVGFETEQARSSIGLRLLQTFAQQLDGAATVVSQSGQGTTVTLIITDPASPASHAA